VAPSRSLLKTVSTLYYTTMDRVNVYRGDPRYSVTAFSVESVTNFSTTSFHGTPGLTVARGFREILPSVFTRSRARFYLVDFLDLDVLEWIPVVIVSPWMPMGGT
jgi:hypothetical protein